jgi:hypothetical protein
MNNLYHTAYLTADYARTTKLILADHLAASGVKNMNNLGSQYCLTMASSLDAEAARTPDDSYLRKLLKEQAAKYRAAAAE